MLDTRCIDHPGFLSAAFLCALLAALVPACAGAQAPDGVVPITSEPDHRIRFDNGKVRMYEVVLAKGKSTLWHEHRADSFSVIFRNTEITNEPYGGKPATFKIPSGAVGFASVEKGPYAHRIAAISDAGFHVIALELLTPSPGGPQGAAPRQGPAFRITRENPRGRVYRVTLGPGESTGSFARQANTAVFAISPGRISEHAEGGDARYWDFEPGHFRWTGMSEKLLLRNEGTTPVDLVEIEIF